MRVAPLVDVVHKRQSFLSQNFACVVLDDDDGSVLRLTAQYREALRTVLVDVQCATKVFIVQSHKAAALLSTSSTHSPLVVSRVPLTTVELAKVVYSLNSHEKQLYRDILSQSGRALMVDGERVVLDGDDTYVPVLSCVSVGAVVFHPVQPA